MRDQQNALIELAAGAYVYGFPLVFDLEQVDRFTRFGMGSTPATPYNSFGHAATLAGPKDTFVSINNDTIYSIAQLDLGVGPLLLEVPDTAGAYYVLQFVDAWTNNFAYVGKRGTGTAAGRFLLTSRGGMGSCRRTRPAIVVPTRVATIVDRWACDGLDDLGRVRGLQSQLTLTPLDPSGPSPSGVPATDPNVPEVLAFRERLRVWMAAFPPAERDLQVQQGFAPLGLLQSGPSPYGDGGSEIAAVLIAAEKAAREALEQAMRSSSPTVDGWQQTFHVFDYNDDFFEVGTVESSQWRIADRSEAIKIRAGAALGGLWGNHGYEAAYAMTYVDAGGNPLTGDHSYVWRLESRAPVNAFWSDHHVRPARVLPRRQPDRPLLDRRPHAGNRQGRRRFDHRHDLANRDHPLRGPTGYRPLPASSAPSCGCTTRTHRSSTAATESHPSNARTDHSTPPDRPDAAAEVRAPRRGAPARPGRCTGDRQLGAASAIPVRFLADVMAPAGRGAIGRGW